MNGAGLYRVVDCLRMGIVAAGLTVQARAIEVRPELSHLGVLLWLRMGGESKMLQ